MIAHKPTRRAEVEVEAEVVKNATNAGRSATSLVPAPILPVLEVATVVATAAVETTALLVVEVEVEVVQRPGMIDHYYY